MTIKIGERGQPLRIATSFDLSSSTGLRIDFTGPDGSTFFKDEVTTPPVTAPAVALVNDPELGNVPASTYFEYITDGTEFTVAGTWTACGFYGDASRDLNANKITFPIGERCS